jgi:hypothetical protein
MDPWNDILGLDLPPDRLQHDLKVFRDISEAIRKLRTLDLTDVHPVVIYDPMLPYRRA